MLTIEKYRKAHLLRDLRDVYWRKAESCTISLFVVLNSSASRLWIYAQFWIVAVLYSCLLHGFNRQVQDTECCFQLII